jgi:hypothetical protein
MSVGQQHRFRFERKRERERERERETAIVQKRGTKTAAGGLKEKERKIKGRRKSR